VDGVRFGDLLDFAERVEDRGAVGVDAPRPVLGGGIAPGDREDWWPWRAKYSIMLRPGAISMM
jgi:hypothetical protein